MLAIHLWGIYGSVNVLDYPPPPLRWIIVFNTCSLNCSGWQGCTFLFYVGSRVKKLLSWLKGYFVFLLNNCLNVFFSRVFVISSVVRSEKWNWGCLKECSVCFYSVRQKSAQSLVIMKLWFYWLDTDALGTVSKWSKNNECYVFQSSPTIWDCL